MFTFLEFLYLMLWRLRKNLYTKTPSVKSLIGALGFLKSRILWCHMCPVFAYWFLGPMNYILSSLLSEVSVGDGESKWLAVMVIDTHYLPCDFFATRSNSI